MYFIRNMRFDHLWIQHNRNYDHNVNCIPKMILFLYLNGHTVYALGLKPGSKNGLNLLCFCNQIIFIFLLQYYFLTCLILFVKKS